MEITWPRPYHQRIPGSHQQNFITKHLTQSKDPSDVYNKQIIPEISCTVHPETTSTKKWSIIKKYSGIPCWAQKEKNTSNI